MFNEKLTYLVETERYNQILYEIKEAKCIKYTYLCFHIIIEV